MSKHTQAIKEDVNQLADDTRALISATADVAGDRVVEARERLANALESGKVMYGRAREKAIEGAKAADKSVRANPYKSIGIGLGVGALIGYLVGRKCSSDRE